MHHPRIGSGWVTRRTRVALVRTLAIRRDGPRPGLGEGELRAAFEQLCAEAVTCAVPPEAVLQEFRSCWDTVFPRTGRHEPRELIYYCTLSHCLDIYLLRLLEGRSSCPSRAAPFVARAGPGRPAPITS